MSRNTLINRSFLEIFIAQINLIVEEWMLSARQ